MTLYKWWSTGFMPDSEPVMSDRDHSLHYGDGVFEGECAYPELDADSHPTGRWHIVLGQQHGQRLVDGGAQLGITCPIAEPEVTAAAAMLVGLNRTPTAKRLYIRRLLTRGAGLGVNPAGCTPTVSIRTAPWDEPYLKTGIVNGGASCYITGHKRFLPDQLPGGVKATGAYLLGTLMKIAANEADASEGLATDYQGNILDTSGSNIYVITKQGAVIYPDPDRTNILGGRTFHLLRTTCFRDLDVVHATGSITLDGFRRGDYVGAFLSGTAMEITPWTMVMFNHPTTGALERLPIGHGQTHDLVTQIVAWYTRFKHGQIEGLRGPDYLTPVPSNDMVADMLRQLSTTRACSAA